MVIRSKTLKKGGPIALITSWAAAAGYPLPFHSSQLNIRNLLKTYN